MNRKSASTKQRSATRRTRQAEEPKQIRAILVLAGGVGLGAYQAGAYEALAARPDVALHWIAASSVGAINASLVAGVPPQQRLNALREYWSVPEHAGTPPDNIWTHATNWVSVLQARAFGVPGFFNTSAPNFFSDQFASLYSLAPSLRRIEQLVDFTLLNATPTRVSIATTDISTGDLVVFENRGGEPIRIDHLAASCGFLPEFAPVEIDGRLLGDGGLAANAPLEALLADDADIEDTVVFVVDLYARDGDRPRDLGSALARKSDLLFGNQTWLRLQALVRELQLKAQIEKLRRKQHTAQLPKFFYLSYRGSAAEPGSEKPFSFSQHAIRSRWEAGVLDMQAALAQVDTSHALTAIRRA